MHGPRSKFRYRLLEPADLEAVPLSCQGDREQIALRIADDPAAAPDRIRKITLTLTLDNLLSADKLTILLNG